MRINGTSDVMPLLRGVKLGVMPQVIEVLVSEILVSNVWDVSELKKL